MVMGSDRKVRVFNFLTGKLYRVFDEALEIFIEQQQVRVMTLGKGLWRGWVVGVMSYGSK